MNLKEAVVDMTVLYLFASGILQPELEVTDDDLDAIDVEGCVVPKQLKLTENSANPSA